MTWSDEDERAAREAASGLGLQHAQLRELAYRAIRAARESGRAEGRASALERVAGVLEAKRAGWDAEMQREQQGRARWNNAARCRIAADDIKGSLVREFGAAWPAAVGGAP